MNHILEWQEIDAPQEGAAVAFSVSYDDQDIEEDAFLICFKGKLHAYINRCPHSGTTLDWNPGQFFSEDGRALVCHTHMAHFDPANGDCISGPSPCGLHTLPIRETRKKIRVPAVLSRDWFDANSSRA